LTNGRLFRDGLLNAELINLPDPLDEGDGQFKSDLREAKKGPSLQTVN
jgi:hypothetical protein